ncbi:MAG: protein kinase [Deltaproteobacteria bacterium]|nr:protein kinase [Deltaproteobacteria bacterium]
MSESRATGPRTAAGRVGSVVNGKWHIDSRLGSGGMATVYAATHRNGHRAALKMLHAQLSSDPDTRARFLREAYVANSVDHPAIVRVQDDGVAEDGSVFLVLDLLEGETIEARRERLGGKLPLGEALSIAEQCLDALGAAHDKGIVHRDVKPDNVFLTKDGHAMLLDFGLARMKSLRAEETKTGVTIGTPEFMPPEQAQGKRDEVDQRSDVWGLGAMLFTMITGRPVHEASSLHEQLTAAAFKRARPVRDLAPDLPPSIAVVIDRALELEKADRWESAREMHRALRNARAPREEAPGFVSDSLTMPAASPASIRRNESAAPASGPRPSSGIGHPVPSSDRTLKEQVLVLDAMPVPSSDKTIDEALPRTPKMLGGEMRAAPSVSPPISSSPTTERLTGPPTKEEAAKVAQIVAAHIVVTSGGGAPPAGMKTTLPSAGDVIVAPPKAVAPVNLAGSGSNPVVNFGASGSNPTISVQQPIAASGQGPAAPSAQARVTGPPPPPNMGPPNAGPPNASPPNASPLNAGPPNAGPPQAKASGSGPHPASGGEPGPVSMRSRRSARTAVIVCVLLILACTAVAGWVMYGRT